MDLSNRGVELGASAGVMDAINGALVEDAAAADGPNGAFVEEMGAHCDPAPEVVYFILFR
jgi:hypothetical protein